MHIKAFIRSGALLLERMLSKLEKNVPELIMIYSRSPVFRKYKIDCSIYFMINRLTFSEKKF